MAKKKVSKKKISKKKVSRKPVNKKAVEKKSTKFTFGNSAWRARSSHGRKPLFKDPEQLRDACFEYFEWVEANPLIAADTVKFQGVGEVMPVPRMRAMTIIGLCNFLDIASSTWLEYKSNTDFSSICEGVENIIYQQKLEGAAADLLNHAIIARELGLADKKEIDVNELDSPVMDKLRKRMAVDQE